MDIFIVKNTAENTLIYERCFKSNASYLFPWKLLQVLGSHSHQWIKQVYITIVFTFIVTLTTFQPIFPRTSSGVSC